MHQLKNNIVRTSQTHWQPFWTLL